MDNDILEKSCVIYCLINLINGKKYVGKTVNKLKKRIWVHKCNKNSYIGRAIQKYGWENFAVEILEECTAEELSEREIFWIKTLNTKSPSGYNLTDGGEGSLGREYSEETRTKIATGVPKRAVRCIDTNEIFPSIKDAANHFEILSSEVWRVCKGQAIRRKGLKFEYVDNPLSEEERLREAKEKGKKVLCIETGNIYDSVAEAARQTGANRRHIACVCHGQRKTCGGYHWQFVQ